MKKGIYCLENLWTRSVKDKISVLPILELMQKADVCNHTYHKIATREEFLVILKQWKTKSLKDKFPILYFAFHGKPGRLALHKKNAYISLEELGNELENCCEGKVLFFASCETLDIHGKVIQSFLRKTGALAVIGYKIEVAWILATAFELLVLNALQEDKFDTKGIKKIQEIIKGGDYGNLHRKLDFRMVINKVHYSRKRS